LVFFNNISSWIQRFGQEAIAQLVSPGTETQVTRERTRCLPRPSVTESVFLWSEKRGNNLSWPADLRA